MIINNPFKFKYNTFIFESKNIHTRQNSKPLGYFIINKRGLLLERLRLPRDLGIQQ